MTADESSLESAGPGSWRPFAAVLGLALVLRLGLLALVLVPARRSLTPRTPPTRIPICSRLVRC